MPLNYGSRVDRRDRRLEARPRPVRRGRRAPARGAGRPHGASRSRTPGSTRRSGARRRARRRCSSSAASLAAAEGLDRVLELVVEGAAQILGAPHASLWLQDAPGGELVGRAGVGASATTRSADAASRRRGGAVHGANRAVLRRRRRSTARSRSRRQAAPAPMRSRRSSVDGRWGAIAVAVARRGPSSASASSSCSAGWPTRRSSRSRTRRASRGSSRPSSPRSRRSRTRSRRATSTTSSHTRWITDTALRVGGELGLDGEAMKRLELGALFHDIGKIGIPNSILLKPAPLTEDERRLIETHPELGERIIAPIDQLRDVCRIVRACHERWDGDGLSRPQGRRGDPARGADHLRLRRLPRDDDGPPVPPRAAVEEALRRLREAAGTQFDPHGRRGLPARARAPPLRRADRSDAGPSRGRLRRQVELRPLSARSNVGGADDVAPGPRRRTEGRRGLRARRPRRGPRRRGGTRTRPRPPRRGS